MTVEEKERFNKLEAQVSEVRKHMFGLGDKLDDVIALLKGDTFGKSDGIIGEMKDHSKRLKKLENLKNRATWMLLGASVPSGYGIWEFLKKMLPPLLILVMHVS